MVGLLWIGGSLAAGLTLFEVARMLSSDLGLSPHLGYYTYYGRNGPTSGVSTRVPGTLAIGACLGYFFGPVVMALLLSKFLVDKDDGPRLNERRPGTRSYRVNRGVPTSIFDHKTQRWRRPNPQEIEEYWQMLPRQRPGKPSSGNKP